MITNPWLCERRWHRDPWSPRFWSRKPRQLQHYVDRYQSVTGSAIRNETVNLRELLKFFVLNFLAFLLLVLLPGVGSLEDILVRFMIKKTHEVKLT